MKRFVFGFKEYFGGLKFWFNRPGLLKISIVPVFIDAVFFGMALYYGMSKFTSVMAALHLQPDSILHSLLYYLAAFVIIVGILLLVAVLVLIAANLVAFPFHDILAERTLRSTGALPAKGEKDFRQKARDFLKNGFVGLRKAVLVAFLGLFLFIASFFPGINMVATVIGLLVLTYDLTDYSFDHLTFSLTQRFRFFMGHFPEFFGFSLALGLTCAIPIINFIAIPGSIVSAARMVALIRSRKPNK